MSAIRYIARVSCLISLIVMLASCIIAPPRDGYREGYYDREHHRWWHDHDWHQCGYHDSHCR